MRVMRLTPCALGEKMILLGKQGEGNALRIEFDCAAWLAAYPQAQVKLCVFVRGKTEPIIPVLGREGTDRVWIVSSEETAQSGNGAIELLLLDEKTGTTIKSATGYTTVMRSPSAGHEHREGQKGYVRYDVDQSGILTEEQKETARSNIGAGTGSGNAGIHIGPEAPQDENAVLWVDTDEEDSETEAQCRACLSYTEFGAALDGVTDDTDAVIACHEYANAHGLRIEQHSGTLYLKTATAQHCPIIKTDCDFTGMSMRIDEYMGKNTIMFVQPDSGVKTHDLSAEEIAQLVKGEINIPFLSIYPNCICHFVTDISVGTRRGHADTKYVYHETVTVDRHGNLMDGTLFRAMTDATAVRMEYQSIFETPITLRGMKVVLDTTDDASIATILVKRSNTTIKDWTFEIRSQTSTDSTEYKGEIVRVENSYNVIIDHLSGENFGTFFSEDAEDKGQTAYLIYLSGLSRCTVRDCVMIRAWGPVQTQYCKDMTFRDCTMGRIDNHYGCRNYHIENCTLSSSQSCINIGYGDGQVVIDNVRFVKYPDPDTTDNNNCIFLRNDFCSLYSGELTIRNAIVENKTGNPVRLVYGGYTDYFDYGDASKLLPLSFPVTKIDGVVIDDNNTEIVNYRVLDESFPMVNGMSITARQVDIANVRHKNADTVYLRLTTHYGYTGNIKTPDRYGAKIYQPYKAEFRIGSSVNVYVRDSHVNSSTGSTVGMAMWMENCYIYGHSDFQYVRDLILHNCHIYTTGDTAILNPNHMLRMTECVFEERSSVKLVALKIPELYLFKGNYSISSVLDDALASMLYDSNNITNSGILYKTEHVKEDVGETWTTDDLTAGASKAFNWNKYLMLVFATGDYSNIRASFVIPVSEFAQTGATHRPVLGWGSSSVQVYQVDENTIYAIGTTLYDNQRLRVWGLMEKGS